MKNSNGYINSKIVIIRKATNDETEWHKLKAGSYIISIEGYPWFDTDAIATVESGIYTDGHNIGLQIRGSLGMANKAVLDIEKTKELLIKAGYTIKNK